MPMARHDDDDDFSYAHFKVYLFHHRIAVYLVFVIYLFFIIIIIINKTQENSRLSYVVIEMKQSITE